MCKQIERSIDIYIVEADDGWRAAARPTAVQGHHLQVRFNPILYIYIHANMHTYIYIYVCVYIERDVYMVEAYDGWPGAARPTALQGHHLHQVCSKYIHLCTCKYVNI